jgi:cobalt-zinc-cadmium efflux system outer membrane protein
LEQAIEKALHQSPRLRSLKAKLQGASASRLQADTGINPSLDLEVENIGGSGQFSGNDYAEYTLSYRQTIERGGKRKARIDVATALQNSVQSELMLAQRLLMRDVHTAYSKVLAKEESLRMAQEQQRLAEQVLTTVTRQVNAARESEIQLSKAKVAFTSSRLKMQQARRSLQLAQQQLVRLWGETTLTVSLDHSHFFLLEPPQALEQYQSALINAPVFQQLSYLKQASVASLRLEKAKSVQNPTLGFGIRKDEFSGDSSLLFDVSMPLALFNSNKGNVARAKAQMIQLDNEWDQERLNQEQLLIQVWQQWSMAFEEANQLKNTIIPEARRAFELAQKGYEKGKYPYFEVLDAQRTLFRTLDQYHDALFRYHRARADIEKMTAFQNIAVTTTTAINKISGEH